MKIKYVMALRGGMLPSPPPFPWSPITHSAASSTRTARAV